MTADVGTRCFPQVHAAASKMFLNEGIIFINRTCMCAIIITSPNLLHRLCSTQSDQAQISMESLLDVLIHVILWIYPYFRFGYVTKRTL